MDYYFLSNLPYHLKANNCYVGKVSKNLRVLSFNESLTFLEFLPISNEYFPCYSDLKCIENIKKFPFLDGEIILPIFDKKPFNTFKILGQKQFYLNGNNYLISIVVDGTVKFYVDGNLSIIEKLPFIPDSFDVFTLNNLAFFTFTSKKTAIFGYEFSQSGITTVFKDIADNFELDSTLKVTKHYNFINPITIFEEWNLTSTLSLNSRKSTFLKPLNEIPQKLIPLSFMETVSVVGDLSIYLTSDLNARANDIYEFIKKPIYLFNLPNSFNEVVSISENEIFTYNFEFSGNLISNFIEK